MKWQSKRGDKEEYWQNEWVAFNKRRWRAVRWSSTSHVNPSTSTPQHSTACQFCDKNPLKLEPLLLSSFHSPPLLWLCFCYSFSSKLLVSFCPFFDCLFNPPIASLIIHFPLSTNLSFFLLSPFLFTHPRYWIKLTNHFALINYSYQRDPQRTNSVHIPCYNSINPWQTFSVENSFLNESKWGGLSVVSWFEKAQTKRVWSLHDEKSCISLWKRSCF